MIVIKSIEDFKSYITSDKNLLPVKVLRAVSFDTVLLNLLSTEYKVADSSVVIIESKEEYDLEVNNILNVLGGYLENTEIIENMTHSLYLLDDAGNGVTLYYETNLES